MSFKIDDLDKFIKEGYEEDPTEPSNDEAIAAELSKLADVPESETGEEEDTIPSEEADVVDGFEMIPEDNGYKITLAGQTVCFVKIKCKGQIVDMETVENPSECVAEISNVVDEEKTAEYQKKLEGMGIKSSFKSVKESKDHLMDKSNSLLEE